MQQQQQAQPEVITWKDRLRDSSWVTIAWDWFQNFLGRVAESVLWCTMIYSCYGLIPGAPQAPASVSSFMFVAQFVALDVGGMGLNKLAQEQGLDRWSYTRIISYILIAITLITLTYAGIEHAVAIPQAVTGWVEAVLVIARSVMTILYAQAIHAMKVDKQHTHELIEQQRVQLESGQREVSTLRSQLDTLTGQVDTLRDEVDGKGQELDAMSKLLERKEREVSILNKQLDTGQESQSSTQREVSTLRGLLEQKQRELERLSTLQQEASQLRSQLDTKQQEVSSLRVQLDSERKRVSSGHRDSGQESEVDSEQGKVVRIESHQRKSGQDDSALGEQILALLIEEPGLSDRAIASKLSCSPTTVGRWRKNRSQASPASGNAERA
jgi:predicted  nucleic acid-binding Zn-ribbon protein